MKSVRQWLLQGQWLWDKTLGVSLICKGTFWKPLWVPFNEQSGKKKGIKSDLQAKQMQERLMYHVRAVKFL